MQPTLSELARWADLIDLDFGLWLRRTKRSMGGESASFFDSCRTVPAVQIAIKVLPKDLLGQYHVSGDLVVLNAIRMDRPAWQVIGTLAHELLHSWQHRFLTASQEGSGHSASYRQRAADHGLVVDRDGHTEYPPDTQFFHLLRRHGISTP